MKIFKPEGWLIDSTENQKAMESNFSLLQACRERKILEARAVICDSKHNLHVDLGCMNGIIPRNETAIGISEGTVRDIAIISRVNKPVCFYIDSFEFDSQGKTYAVLSRRAVQEECKKSFLSSLIPGDIVDARVTHLEPFGAFVDIGCGIPSLLPIDMISVSRISHPGDRFTTGMDIRVIVKTIDEDLRISLSHKELLGTWAENAELFKPGETVAGIVRSIEDYGVFVELAPNLAGLAELNPNLRVGEQTSVYVKSILEDKMKIKLVIIDSFNETYIPQKPRYFFSGDHIDSFQYSPPNASRQISIFF